MSAEPSTGPAVYELTVKGSLGPVLRNALCPAAATVPTGCTIVRTGVGSEADVAELVRALQAKGFDVEGIFDVTG